MKLCIHDDVAGDVEVLDLDSGDFIKNCVWVDITHKIYGVLRKTTEGDVTSTKRGNIVLVYKGD